MATNAYEPTEEDVENVLRSNSLFVANTNGKSFESIANEIFPQLDFERIEEAALFGDDLDQQTDYANDEIARQLREIGILEPLKQAVVYSSSIQPPEIKSTQAEPGVITKAPRMRP